MVDQQSQFQMDSNVHVGIFLLHLHIHTLVFVNDKCMIIILTWCLVAKHTLSEMWNENVKFSLAYVEDPFLLTSHT